MATRTIYAGPSKFDLMLSLFEGKQVSFGAGQETFTVTVVSIQKDDGGNESWHLAGNIIGQNLRTFTAYFNTQHRQGHFQTAD